MIILLYLILCSWAQATSSLPNDRTANVVNRDDDRRSRLESASICRNPPPGDEKLVVLCQLLRLHDATTCHIGQSTSVNGGQTGTQRSSEQICSESGNSEDMSIVCKQLKWFTEHSNIRYPLTRLKPVVDAESKTITLKESTIAEESDPENLPKIMEAFSKSFEIISSGLDAIEKLSDIGEKIDKLDTAATKFAMVTKVAKGLAKAGKAIGAFGTIASILGPVGAAVGTVFSLIALFIPQPDTSVEMLKVINAQFDRIHQRFDKLERRLDALELTIKKTAVFQMYKENQDRIHKVWFAHRQLFMNPGHQSMVEFLDACRSDNPLYSLEWIHRRSLERGNAFGLHLFPSILNDTQYDRVKLAQFFEAIKGDMMMAAYLREACLGVQAPNNTKVIWTNRRIISVLVSDVFNSMTRLDKELMEKFHRNQLVLDVQNWLDLNAHNWRENTNSDKTFIDSIKMALESKYFWLTFHIDLIVGGWYSFTPMASTNYKIVDASKHRGNGELLVTWSKSQPLLIHELVHCDRVIPKPFTNDHHAWRKIPQILDIKIDQNWWKQAYENKYALVLQPHDRLATTRKETDEKCKSTISTKELDAVRGTTRKYSVHIWYYESGEQANAFGCQANPSDLQNAKVSRFDACSDKALQRLLQEKANEAVKLAIGRYKTQHGSIPDKQNEIMSEVFPATQVQSDLGHSLRLLKPDFHLVVLFFDKNYTQKFGACNQHKLHPQYVYKNCSFWETPNHLTDGKANFSFVFSYSHGKDTQLLEEQAIQANRTLKLIRVLYEHGVIFQNAKNNRETFVQQVHELLGDSLRYFTKKRRL